MAQDPREELVALRRMAELEAKASGGARESAGQQLLSTLGTAAKEAFTGPYEAAASLASGTAGSIAGGIAGGVAAAIPGGEPGVGRAVSEGVADTLTYQPRTTTGRVMTNAVAYPFQKLAEGAHTVGGFTTEQAAQVLPVRQSAELGTLVGTGIEMVPALLGRGAGRMKPSVSNIPPSARAAAEKGYALTPEEMGAGSIAKGLSSLAGEPRLAKSISLKNQEVTNSKVAKDLGLAEDTVLSADAVKAVRTEAAGAFEKARGMGRVTTDVKFFDDITNIIKERTKAETDFPTKRDSSPVRDAIEELRVKDADADSIVSKIRTLREDADKAFSARDKELGFVYKEASKALEQQLIRHAQKTGQDPKIVQDMINARERIAKSYAAQKALDGKGNINPQSYASDLRRGKPLTGEALDVAKTAGEFPRSNQPTANIGGTGATLADALLAAVGPDGMGAKSALLGARPLARLGLKSDIGQAAMLNPPAILEAIRRGQALPATSLAEIAAEQRK